MRLLKAGGGASREEEDILSSFEWSKNEAVLHWDERVRRSGGISLFDIHFDLMLFENLTVYAHQAKSVVGCVIFPLLSVATTITETDETSSDFSAWNYLTSSNKPSKFPRTTASDVNTVAL